MATQAFIDSVIKEIIQPGVDQLLALPYFTELRAGKLSIKRLQGWALQHYLHNGALLKGFALCMVKNSHEPDLFKYFLYQINEEQYHPDLAKKFGLAIGLQEEDFVSARPVFECLAHTSKTIHGMLIGSASENRASALVNETMVCRYSEEHIAALRLHYGLGDKQIQFFTVHAVADQEHTAMACEASPSTPTPNGSKISCVKPPVTWCDLKSPSSKGSTTPTRDEEWGDGIEQYWSVGCIYPLLPHSITPKHLQPKLTQCPPTHNNGHYA